MIVTSDKVYKNLEILRGYHEEDILGGYDPYSASKASADLAVKSYFLSKLQYKNLKICIARAGNVIGGGDWSEGRLIPDCVKKWSSKNCLYKKPKVHETLAACFRCFKWLHEFSSKTQKK